MVRAKIAPLEFHITAMGKPTISQGGSNMPRTTLFAFLALLGALSTLFGCDRQVDTKYQGESLLTIRGNVVIPSQFEGRELVPALTWEAFSLVDGRYERHTEIMDVEVEGEFPSKFTLLIFNPPPATAIKDFEPEELPMAKGYITAVYSSHPKAIQEEDFFCSTEDPRIENTVYHVTCPYSPNAPGIVSPDTADDLSNCIMQSIDLSTCIMQSFDCTVPADFAGGSQTLNDCTLLGTEGIESLAFAGYSQNIVIFYFPSPVSADTETAFGYNEGKAIKAGYHLYRIHPESLVSFGTNEEDMIVIRDCNTKKEEIAAELYNKEHGTYFTAAQLSDKSHPGYWDFRRARLEAKRIADCYDPFDTDPYYTPIENPETTPVSIELGTVQAT
jgi:hypothetical protein